MAVSLRVPDPTLRVGYRRTWSTLAVAVGAVGAAGAALTTPPVVVAVSAATSWLVVQVLAGTSAWSAGRSPLRTVLPSLAVGCLVPVVPGAVALLGPAAAALWVVLALTAPPLVSWVVTSLGAWSPAHAPVASRVPDPPVVDADAPVRELVRLWSASTQELAARPGPVRTAVLVGVRAAVLDALQRRDPRGFEAWLAHDPTRTSPRAHLGR